MPLDRSDVRKTETRKIYGITWRFLFLEDKSIRLEMVVSDGKKVRWMKYLRGLSIQQCLDYIQSSERKTGDKLVWDDLEKI